MGKIDLILLAVIKREHLKTIIMCHLSLYSSNCCLIAKCGLNTISSISRLATVVKYIYRHCNEKFTKEHPGELTKWTFTQIHSRFLFLAMSEGVATNTYHIHTRTARSGLQLVYHVIIILVYLARNLALERSFSVNCCIKDQNTRKG